MKFRLNKPKPRNWRNVHAKGRKTTKPRTDYCERELMRELAPPVVRRGDYLFANCVVLAAAVFGTRARRWAEELLPCARLLDWRRSQ